MNFILFSHSLRCSLTFWSANQHRSISFVCRLNLWHKNSRTDNTICSNSSSGRLQFSIRFQHQLILPCLWHFLHLPTLLGSPHFSPLQIPVRTSWWAPSRLHAFQFLRLPRYGQRPQSVEETVVRIAQVGQLLRGQERFFATSCSRDDRRQLGIIANFWNVSLRVISSNENIKM